MDEAKLTYSVSEAARLLGLSRNSTYLACFNGELPHVKIGRRILIPKRALEMMLESAANGAKES